MGWGASASNRQKLLGPDTIKLIESLPPADEVYVDLCAVVRKQCVGIVPPPTVAKRIVQTIAAALKPGAFVCACFDNSHYALPCRAELHAKRYAKAPPVVATEQQVRDVLRSNRLCAECPWDVLFAGKKSKAQMMQLMYEEICKAAIAYALNASDPPLWEISKPNCPHGFVWSYPFLQNCDAYTFDAKYGEAEAQIVQRMRERTVQFATAQRLVWTIDTDMILQTMCAECTNVTIAIARIWQEPSGEVARSRAKATSKARMVWECVDVSRVVYGKSKAELLWKLFSCLAIGGCDYTTGLGRFGFTTDSMLSLQKKTSPFTAKDDTSFSLDVTDLCRALAVDRKSHRGDKPGNNSGASHFVNEINLIIFCMRYYTWQEAGRANAAGPREIAYITAGQCTTVTAFLKRKQQPQEQSQLVEMHDGCPL